MAPRKSASTATSSQHATSSSIQTSSNSSTTSNATSSTKISNTRSTATAVSSSSTPGSTATSTSKSSAALPRNPQDIQQVAATLFQKYVDTTPQRTKLVDVFLAFLVVVGVLQFLYCVVAGNYPFNAFLAGFSATVGQFVLTASLRIQTNPANQADFEKISHERAFADFVFGSLILHFFCVNFIN